MKIILKDFRINKKTDLLGKSEFLFLPITTTKDDISLTSFLPESHSFF